MARPGSTRTARAREMRRLLGEFERSGLTLQEFGRQRGVRGSTLSWWRYVFRHSAREEVARRKESASLRRAARQRRASVPFVEVKLSAPESASAASVFEVVLQSGHLVRVPPHFDPVSLRALVSALGSPC